MYHRRGRRGDGTWADGPSIGPCYSLAFTTCWPLLCPASGGPIRILSFLTDPPVVTAILVHLEFPHTPPPISPARGPPKGDFLLDQTPAFDPTEAEPAPDFVFDQSLPDESDD